MRNGMKLQGDYLACANEIVEKYPLIQLLPSFTQLGLSIGEESTCIPCQLHTRSAFSNDRQSMQYCSSLTLTKWPGSLPTTS